jgi:TolB-like protein
MMVFISFPPKKAAKSVPEEATNQNVQKKFGRRKDRDHEDRLEEWTPMIGRTLGHYRILGKIGAGGMGVVYRARDERLERDIALKVLPAGALADEETRRRFRTEALALSQLNHPNIATIHDFNSEGGVDFLAMELIAGDTLIEKLRAGALAEAEVVRLGRQIAEALGTAHERRLIHRDLKPGNIMVTPKGLVKVLDFGLAKILRPARMADQTLTLTGTPSLSGTLPYMAPEQLEGRDADERTDIHAVGAVLFELATGRRLFPQDAASQIVRAIVSQIPDTPSSLNPQVSQGLERIILKCVQKNPDDRYASAGELLADLGRLEAGDISGLIAGPPAARSKGRARLRMASVAASVLAALALAFGLNLGGLRNRLAAGAGSPRIRSLAVLPLENISRDPNEDYLADGLTDALISELGQISTLRVISRTSMSQYRETAKILAQIAKELKADAIVEGSVQKSADRVRITAKLIRPADEKQLWGRSYERGVGDALVLQKEIAGDITRQIGVRLSEETQLQLSRRKPTSPQALDAYFKGVYSDDPEHFKQAITIDPDFALAYSRLASSYFYSGLFGDIPPREAFAMMKEAALKALEKDDTLGEAHGYLAVAWFHNDLNGPEAEKEFKKAFALNPSLAMLHHLYAHYLMAMDRIDESLAEVRLADELDPFAWDRSQCFGWHCLFSEGYDEAIEEALKGIQADPENDWAHVILGWAYEQRSMINEAIVEFQAAAKTWKDHSIPLAGLGHAFALSGRTKEAHAVLDRLLEMSRTRYVPAYDVAVVYMGLGEKARAFEWLNKAYEERSGFLVYIKCDRRFDGLRSDPRFVDLLGKIGLPAGASEK